MDKLSKEEIHEYAVMFEDDVKRISRITGQENLDLCAVFWIGYSRSFWANWLILPDDDDEVLNAVHNFYDEDDDFYDERDFYDKAL